MKTMHAASRVVVVALAAAVAGGCAMIPSQPRSFQRKDEEVTVAINHKTKARGLPLLAAAAIPAACDFLIKRVSADLKTEVQNFTAEYSASVSDDLFYVPGARGLEEDPEDREINIQSIVVTRWVNVEGLGRVPAFELELKLRPAFDQTAFQLVPVRAKMDYSKVKMVERTWTRPWTYAIPADDTVDVDVDLAIEAYWIDENGESHIQPMARLTLPLRGLKLGEERTEFGDTVTEWFPAVPPSVALDADGTRLYGTGNYTFRARVTEYDDAGQRVARYSETLEDHREKWMDQMLKNLKKK